MEMENIIDNQELVETMAEKATEAAANIVTTTTTTVPPITTTPKKSYTGLNIAAGAGMILGGGALGFALDHWVIPYFSEEQRNARKEKREAKKAEKKAKKEAKKAKQPAPAPKEPKNPGTDDGIDPNTIDTKI